MLEGYGEDGSAKSAELLGDLEGMRYIVKKLSMFERVRKSYC